MAPIPGSIRATGFFATSDSTDTYAVTDSIYNRGGYREVANITERNAITTDRRREGMLVYVQSEIKFYYLQGGITNSNWVEFIGASPAPALPETQLAFGNPTNTITSSSDLTWDDTNKQLQTPSLVLTSSALSSIIAGKLEYNGTNLYFSTSGLIRNQVMLVPTPAPGPYTYSNAQVLRSINARDLSWDSLVDLVCTIVSDLKSLNILS